MTELTPDIRVSPRVHHACTPCAPPTRFVLAICATLLPLSAQAGPGWDAFVARCLDPFEHQTLSIVDWVAQQVASGRYVREAGWPVSNEWIEPRVKVRIEGGAFRVVETDLES